MADDLDQRIRLVVLGGGGVGKTSIIKRFLFHTFDEKYRSTVEDLYYREYDIGSLTIKVDMLDTAGDLQFPAMRRLSIATAGAFLLVYSVTCSTSLDILKQCFEEIRENRSDYSEIPIVVVGNKSDVDDSIRQIPREDVAEWVYCELPRLKVKVLECSAKTGVHVGDVFRSFLQLSKLHASTDDSVLKRRSSAYGSIRADGRLSPSPRRESISTSSGGGGGGGGTTLGLTADVEASGGGDRLKPRSRSLIRRSSRKAAKLRDAAAHQGVGGTNAPDECNAS